MDIATMTDALPQAGGGPAHAGADAKWAALVNDELVPLPRRRLAARDILAQAGSPEGETLVRDLNSPNDVGISADTIVDLAEGNVFLTASSCSSFDRAVHGASPKLAFVVDDAWEVTTNPEQTAESLHGLFGLGQDVELLRDFESPRDEPILPHQHVRFRDGPVFRTQKIVITVKVNNKPVRFTKRRVTGLEIKQAAIAQGVEIDLECVLYPTKPEGGNGPAIPDTAYVVLHECDEFKCVAPDDAS